MSNKIIIVDENDNIIGSKERATLKDNEIYRVSALWITNSKNEILLARRHHTKSNHPNCWGPAVSGTVDEGETYETNILKETKEELGLTGVQPILGPKTKLENVNHFTQWYTLTLDKNIEDFIFQKEEVEELKWFSKKEFLENFQTNPKEFIPRMKMYFDLFQI